MFMVGQPYVNMGQLREGVEQVTEKMTQLANKAKQKPQEISQTEIDDLCRLLHDCNVSLEPDSEIWTDRRFATAQMKDSIEKALKAIALFQMNRPEQNKTIQQNVSQAIVGILSASLSNEVKAFDKNLKHLKKDKLGRRVEKIENIHKNKAYQ